MVHNTTNFMEHVCELKCEKVRICSIYKMFKKNKELINYLKIDSCIEFLQVK